jgi:hypothetical protein
MASTLSRRAALAALVWLGTIGGKDVPFHARAARATIVVAAVSLVFAPVAFAGIIDDAVRASLQGMLDYVVWRVNSMTQATVPTTFANLFDGGGASSVVYSKALQFYGSGIAKSVASTILALVMLVQLVKISERCDGHGTFPAVREVMTLLVACSIYTYLVGHAWDLMAALFTDLSAIWSGWGASTPQQIADIDLPDMVGLDVLMPMFLSTTVCMILADAAVIVAKVVVWGRGMQLYFMATMSPIPLALLGIEETRQMGVGFLKNFASLVLGYAALSFTLNLYPTLLQMAVSTSWQAGGAGDMVLSVTAGCILEIFLVLKCGSWARDVLGG